MNMELRRFHGTDYGDGEREVKLIIFTGLEWPESNQEYLEPFESAMFKTKADSLRHVVPANLSKACQKSFTNFAGKYARSAPSWWPPFVRMSLLRKFNWLAWEEALFVEPGSHATSMDQLYVQTSFRRSVFAWAIHYLFYLLLICSV